MNFPNEVIMLNNVLMVYLLIFLTAESGQQTENNV